MHCAEGPVRVRKSDEAIHKVRRKADIEEKLQWRVVLVGLRVELWLEAVPLARIHFDRVTLLVSPCLDLVDAVLLACS